MDKTPEQINEELLYPLYHASWRFYIAVAILSSLVVAALAAWGYQVYYGLGMAGLNRPVFWPFTSQISFSGSASATPER
jgi:hypothetical protein